MYDIRLYDYEFNLIHIEHSIISVNAVVKYNDIGSFEAHFPVSAGITLKALENPYLVVVMGDLQALITGKQANGNEFILYGKTVNWILSRRVTHKFTTYKTSFSTNAEILARTLVEKAFDDVENFVLDDMCNIEYSQEFWRNTANQTSEVVKDCLDNAGAGHRVLFDRVNKRWVFGVFVGREIPLIISEANGNAYDSRFSEDIQDYYSSGWYEKISANSDEGEWVQIVKDGDKTGIYKWDGVLYGTSASEGNNSLNNKKWRKITKMQTRNLRFGIDYSLGDIVRVQTEFGEFRQSVKKRIGGVEMWFENNNFGEEPVFSDV
ncbi:MAG: hypothetical protein J1F64_09050 [Oscillospiraceae bacterium]|nr:hypothetical protein [Oscillospiraceae bacterium]